MTTDTKAFHVAADFSKAKRPPIALTPVESNQVGSVGYDEATKTLAVQFKRGAGAIYHYPNVGRDVADNFLGAESKGKFFDANIKGREFEKFPKE